MKNFLKAITVTAISASCLAIISCANPKATQTQTETATPESNKVLPSALKPIFSIAAPDAAVLTKFVYFYDQDRGDSFFITAPSAKTLFQIGAEEGQLMQRITKTARAPLSDNTWVREVDSTLFLLNGVHDLQALGINLIARSFGTQKLKGLVNPEAMAISKLTPGYQIAIVDSLPTGAKLKFFRADLKAKNSYDEGDLDLLGLKTGSELDLGENGKTSLSTNTTGSGFIITQGKTMRFIDNDGLDTEQSPITLKANTIAMDVMACNRGTDKGYWIALQQTEAGYQIELLRRLSFESLGVVSLDGVKSVTDMRFMGRSTKYLPNGGVFMIADGKLAAYNWHDIAAALGARKMCF